MKQLYAQLVDAKRRQNESTAAVTYQSVAKTLQESGEKLREKHGRPVDFEVAIKDGKAVLRPVIK
jgi:muramidase (phage lysozyme)